MTDRPITFSAPMVLALLAGRKTQTRRMLKPQPPAECGIRYMLGNESWLPIEQRTPLRHSWEAWHGPLYEARPKKALAGSFQVRMRAIPGDRLWVRESYFQFGHWNAVEGAVTRKGGRQKWRFTPDSAEVRFDPPVEFRKGRHANDSGTPAWHQRLARFMPRSASRLTLTVTDVRVQRLQEISEADAWAEGCERGLADHVGGFFPAEVPHPKGGFQGWDTAQDWFADLWEGLHGIHAWDANPFIFALTFNTTLGNIDA